MQDPFFLGLFRRGIFPSNSFDSTEQSFSSTVMVCLSVCLSGVFFSVLNDSVID
jgi:hypothetical protein